MTDARAFEYLLQICKPRDWTIHLSYGSQEDCNVLEIKGMTSEEDWHLKKFGKLVDAVSLMTHKIWESSVEHGWSVDDLPPHDEKTCFWCTGRREPLFGRDKKPE